MKIVYMGTPDFAVPPLAALVQNGYEAVSYTHLLSVQDPGGH